MTLRIHADRSALPPGTQHVQLLYPFWGAPAEDPRDVSRGRFDAYAREAPTLFELSSFDDADIVLYPAAWETMAGNETAVAEASALADRARSAGKPFVVFFVSDSAEPVPIDDAFVFRTSMYRSKRRPGEHALPAWTEDFVERYFGGVHDIRPKRERPTVGFMGYDTPIPPLHKRVAKRLLGRPVVSSRGRALRAFRRSELVERNFVVNDAFFGGATRGGAIDWDVQQRARLDYVENMRTSDYILAARGSETWGPTAGNFSYRLYEVLGAGRVPICVNTDNVMPFEEILDWKSFTLWLEEDEVDDADTHLRRFHDPLDDESFARLQRSARAAWVEYLSPHGFFRNFHRFFDQA